MATSTETRQQRQRWSFDAVSMLTVYMTVLYAFPSGASLTALSSVGRPSTIVGLLCLAWWGFLVVQRSEPIAQRRQPVRIALAVLVVSILVSYIVANSHGLPMDERSPADSALIRLASWVGPALLAIDGIKSTERLVTLLHRVALAGAATATLGLAQFVTGHELAAGLQLPGFTSQSSGLEGRGDFVRASGMAVHPLEYATALSAALPLALNAAIYLNHSGALRRWYPSAVNILASLLAVSRSAILGTVVGIAVLVPSWPRRTRGRVALGGVGILALVYVAVPGMIGTIRGMFSGGGDASTESRVDSWGTAFRIAREYVLVGRGLGTFLPTYRILDNGYLLMLIEIGVLGLSAFLAMVVAAVAVALRASRTCPDVALRNQVRALAASLCAVGMLALFFDVLSFPQAVGTLFLLVGAAGAAGNVARRLHPSPPTAGDDCDRAQTPPADPLAPHP